MKLHQVVNSIGIKIYNGYWYKGHPWQKHLHKSFEFVFVEEGSIDACIGKNRYVITKGQSALIMPYEPHTYSVSKDTVYFVAIFSGDLCEGFKKSMQGKAPQSHVFNLERDTVSFLKKHMMAGVEKINDVYRVPDPQFFYIKASIYTVCAAFMEQATLIQTTKNNTTANLILDYIEKNFCENISLKTLSESLGYDYHYISRVFNESFNVNFKTLINQYRCEKAAYMLLSSDKTVAEIALICGFQSLRTFNRVFYEYSNQTPTEYKSNKKI